MFLQYKQIFHRVLVVLSLLHNFRFIPPFYSELLFKLVPLGVAADRGTTRLVAAAPGTVPGSPRGRRGFLAGRARGRCCRCALLVLRLAQRSQPVVKKAPRASEAEIKAERERDMSWAAETRGALVCSADTFRLAAVGVAYVLVFVFYFVFLYRRNPDAVFFFSKKTGTTIILLLLEIPLKSYNNLQLLLWTLLSSFVVCVVGLQQCVVFSCFPFFKCVRLRVRAQIPCVREHRRYVSRGEILVFLECVSPWEVWGGGPRDLERNEGSRDREGRREWRVGV